MDECKVHPTTSDKTTTRTRNDSTKKPETKQKTSKLLRMPSKKLSTTQILNKNSSRVALYQTRDFSTVISNRTTSNRSDKSSSSMISSRRVPSMLTPQQSYLDSVHIRKAKRESIKLDVSLRLLKKNIGKYTDIYIII